MLKWKWGYDKASTDKMTLKFGVPESLFEPYIVNKENLEKRAAIMKDGMLYRDGSYLIPDKNAMINYYKPFLEPLVNLSRKATEGYSSRDRLEFLLRFTQDIPYGVPPNDWADKYIAGIFPPPQVFANGWGDCDSKAVLLGCMLSYYPDDYEAIIVHYPGHVMMGFEGVPKPYENYTEYRNKRYILCEQVGPARTKLGQLLKDRGQVKKVEPLVWE